MVILVNAILLFSLTLLILYVYFQKKKEKSLIAKEKMAQSKAQAIQEQLHRHRSNLDNLLTLLMEIHEFGMAAVGTASKNDLSLLIINSACRLMRSENGSLMLIDQQTNELSIVASVGIPEDVINTTRMKIGEGVAGRVAQTGKPLFVDNIETDIRFLKASNVRYPSKSFLSVPLRVKDKIIEGVFLPEQFKKARIPIHCYGGKGALSFRMYPHGIRDLIGGWSKGFATGAIQTSIPALIIVVAWIVGCVGVARHLIQTIFAGNTTLIILGAALYLCYVLQIYWMLFRIGRFRFHTALLFPIPLLFFIVVFARSMILIFFKKSVQWKGRSIDTTTRRPS